MTEAFVDTHQLAFTCLQCRDLTQKSVRWFVHHTRLFCPACGHEHDIAESDTRTSAMRIYDICKDLPPATTSPL